MWIVWNEMRTNEIQERLRVRTRTKQAKKKNVNRTEREIASNKRIRIYAREFMLYISDDSEDERARNQFY